MEGLGEKFKAAREARGLTLEEAGRMTKIRPNRLAEIEVEDFANFPSLAYAKGFLVIYGKFLNVDVSQYLEAFEAPNAVTVDGYSYLQDNPGPAPSRPVIRATAPKPSLLPLVIGLAVLIIGFSLIKLFLNMQRIAPARADEPAAVATATPAPVDTSGPNALVAAPRPGAATAAPVQPAPTPAPVETATPPPAMAAESPAEEGAPEVRRAEPVNPSDLARFAATGSTEPVTEGAHRVEINPVRRTFVRVVVDGQTTAFERWITPGEGPFRFTGKRVTVRLSDPGGVEITKNGRPLGNDDSDVSVE